MEQDEIKQLLEENKQLRAELADEKQHIHALKEIRRQQSNRDRKIPSPKQNQGYRVVHFKEIRQFKTPKGERMDNVFFVLIETPWPTTLPYETAKSLWLDEAIAVLAQYGYTEFFPDGKHITLRDRFLPKSHPTIDSIAFYDSISYRADSYYTISFYAGSAPKIFP